MDRRRLLGLGIAGLLPLPAIAATSASRSFRIIRDGSDIGTHTLSATKGPNGFEIDITIRIAVKLLGITVYRYEMDNREVWSGGKLQSIQSRVNDDGTDDFVTARRENGKLMIDGSSFTGEAPDGIVTTSYYNKAFLDRRPWMSTQSGRLLSISVAKGGPSAYKVSGDLVTTLEYDERGEWINSRFDAGGEAAFYEITGQSGLIGELWASA